MSTGNEEPKISSYLKPPREDTPLRRRARQRAQHAQRAQRAPRYRTSFLPPLWILLAAGAFPLLFVLSMFWLRQAQKENGQASNAVPSERFVVTATLEATSIIPSSFYEWLTATPPSAPTPTPTIVMEFQHFASATPSFSLYNSDIVFVCYVNESDEICVMKADGSGLRQITDRPGTDWYPSFSPDGRSIIFSSQGRGDFNIFRMDLNGDDLQQLTHNMGDNYAPALSPDGTRIVFASTSGGGQNIWVMNHDGSNPIRLTHDTRDDVDPVWSPDGQRISFTSTRHSAGDLMVMNADGSNLRQVTHGISVEGRNDWSSDNRYLTFYAGPAGDKDIYLVDVDCMSIDGGCGPDQIRKLTHGGNNKGPGFSPDGQWITFASQYDGDNEIFIVRIDGTELYQLTANRRADWQPRWGWQP
ncbi:MAG: PD40 domain-containing protein [Anaerolineae bacterium]|nr:PD40 domain-containing protein [Anaerolineae bacterium]